MPLSHPSAVNALWPLSEVYFKVHYVVIQLWFVLRRPNYGQYLPLRECSRRNSATGLCMGSCLIKYPLVYFYLIRWLQTAALKLDVQDSAGCSWFTYMWDGSFQGSGMVSPSQRIRSLTNGNVSRLPCHRHRSLVKVIPRETGCGPLVFVCCVSVPPRVRIQSARCWCVTVN